MTVNVSSRTPEGRPLRCEICGAIIAVEMASPGDTLCPRCGSLLWAFQSHLAKLFGVPATEISLDFLEGDFARDLAADSLDLVELLMSIDDQFGHHLLDPSDLEGNTSIRDLIALIRQREQDEGDVQ